MRIKTQIVYIPPQADNIEHPDAQFGFVTQSRPKENDYLVRFWKKDGDGFPVPELSTELSSISVPQRTVLECVSFDDAVIDRVIAKNNIEIGGVSHE